MVLLLRTFISFERKKSSGAKFADMCNSRIPRLWPQAIPLKEMMIPKEVRDYCRKKESWSHYPFTFKDFLGDLLDIIKSAKFARGFMKGKTLKSKGEKDNGKHRKERDHHH